MLKPIIYKEWIKTRWYLILALLVSIGFTAYGLLKIERVIDLMGAVHLWQIMLERDAIFIDSQSYIPLLIGIGLAIVQFVPEMMQSRLKLTLHLPCNQFAIIGTMLAYGLVVMLILAVANFAIMLVYMTNVFAIELTRHVLLTAITWYVTGFTAYLLTSWICLEPTWKRRIFNIILSVCGLSVFFQSTVPEAYNGFIVVLVIYTILLVFLPMLSVHRFKTGHQD